LKPSFVEVVDVLSDSVPQNYVSYEVKPRAYGYRILALCSLIVESTIETWFQLWVSIDEVSWPMYADRPLIAYAEEGISHIGHTLEVRRLSSYGEVEDILLNDLLFYISEFSAIGLFIGSGRNSLAA